MAIVRVPVIRLPGMPKPPNINPGNFNIKTKFKMVYFDRSVIKMNWKKMNDRPLRRAGALVRRIAVNSIKVDRRKKVLKSGKRGSYGQPSPVMSPPFSRAPGRPFKMIRNLPYQKGLSEIVGMVGFGGWGVPTPGLHEHGGYARRRVLIKSSDPGKRALRTVHYPKRPFMKPALVKAKRQMPELWRNTLS